MNKTRKLLALIIGAAAAAAALHGVTAEAWSYTPSVSDPAEAPEGYETFDGAYSDYLRIYPIEDAVAFYRSTDNPMLFAAFDNLVFSRLDITVTNDGWEDIYNKYSHELGMDRADVLADGKLVRMSDYVNIGGGYEGDAEADAAERYNAVDDKFDTLMTMCGEMYESGCIESAVYVPFYASSQALYVDSFRFSGFTGSEEEITAAVSGVNEGAAVFVSEADGYLQGNVIFAYDGASADDVFAAMDAVAAIDGEHTVFLHCEDVIDWDNTAVTSPEITSESVDLIGLLASESAVPAGDINSDGKTSILDVITLAKVNAGLIELNTERTAAADLNDDGEVDSADLTILLEFIVGLIDTI